MKRIFDFVLSSIGLFIFLPIILFACLGIYYQDKHSPFYIAKRTGKNNKNCKYCEFKDQPDLCPAKERIKV